MVCQRHENTGMGKQHVNQNDGVCTEHDAVGGVTRRQSDIVNDNEEDTSDGTGLRARLEAQHSVVSGMLLNDVHTAIVQIDGVDEMDTETTIQYDTIPSVTCEPGNPCDDQDETPQDSTWVQGEDVGQVDNHQVRDRGEQPFTSNLKLSAGDCCATENGSDCANDGGRSRG